MIEFGSRNKFFKQNSVFTFFIYLILPALIMCDFNESIVCSIL
jgi:hypothetical protein